MIPSPTKLALLTGVVLLIGQVSSHPARYDQRQDGDINFRADVADVVLVAIPPKDYISNGLTWLGANFIRHNPNRIPSRTPSKHGFVPTEKSPYKVDLGKSTIPLMKLQSPIVEEIKFFKIRDAVADEDQSKVLMSVLETTTEENKTVKKDLKTETPEVSTKAPEEKTEEEESKVEKADVAQPADCGPRERRDSTGKCVHE